MRYSYVAELPRGKWRMCSFRDLLIFVESTGVHSPIVMTKDNEMHTLTSLPMSPEPEVFIPAELKP